jgi:diaminohydroxyphosphoribosylaminopyrimidine deaminase/5-amino-6-(5-phosphoribosylamino)uracil reductase
VLLYTESSSRARRQELAAVGAEVVVLQRVTAASVLADLLTRGIRSVLVEGGPTVAGMFFAQRLYDRVAIACAPTLIGGAAAPGPLAGDGIAALAEAPRLSGLRLRRRGGDVIVEGMRSECLRELSSSSAG